MAINVSVQYIGGLPPDIILLTQCYYVYLQPMIHLNILTFFPPDWGMLRRSRCVLIFPLKTFF